MKAIIWIAGCSAALLFGGRIALMPLSVVNTRHDEGGANGAARAIAVSEAGATHRLIQEASLLSVREAPLAIHLAGTIERVGERDITLLDEDALRTVTVSVPEAAAIFRNGRPASLDQLLPGDLARIEAVAMKPHPTATVIHATELQ